jgi:hypothetical protein
VHFYEPKEQKDLQLDSKEFNVASRLYPRNSEFKAIASSREVIKDTLKWELDTYILAQG